MKRLTLTLGPLALAAVLAACSGASAAPGSDTPSAAPAGGPSGDALTIVAKDLKFSQPAVLVKADAAFAIDFDNRDGAPHNIAISDASGKNVFKGEIVSGSKVTYQVPALAAGTYGFICEVHPDMKGTITAQ
jgi:plastocyanin